MHLWHLLSGNRCRRIVPGGVGNPHPGRTGGHISAGKEKIFDLLQRKPGQGELSSPRREPDIPVIYSGVNAADTMTGFTNEGYTNGTPLTILIPNLDRHFEHIEQYRSTNRTPRPGHASYASYQKYGQWDDSAIRN